MCQNMANIDLIPVKMNRSNKPIFISIDVKDDKVSDFISRRERIAQFTESGKINSLHDSEPAGKRIYAVRMTVPKLLKRFS